MIRSNHSTTRNRALCLLLIVAMLFSLLPSYAFAAQGRASQYQLGETQRVSESQTPPSIDSDTALTTQPQIARTQQTLKATVADRQIVVSGELPDGAELSAKSVSLDAAAKMVEERFGENALSVCFAYDITILVDGAHYQPADFGDSVTVTIGDVAMTDDLAVLHFKSDDTVETLPVQADGDAAAFETDSFSVYIGVNEWIKLPGTIWYDGANFYENADCTAIINDADGNPFTDMQSIISHIDGDLTIYMKAGYTVSDTQSITSGTVYTVTLKRNADNIGNLITVSSTGNLTLANIIVDGGAVWGGTPDSTLGRGTENSGVAAQASLISASGTLTIERGSILQNNENLGTNGGAISAAAPVVMNGGEIRNNAVGTADASSYGGGISFQASFAFYGGIIFGNSALTYGGGVYSSSAANFTMTSGEIYCNSVTGAAGRGGGVFINTNAICTISGGKIYENKASVNGGGVFCYGAATFEGGFIYDNRADASGGGICIGDLSVVNITGGEIFENSALSGGGIYCTAFGTRLGNTVETYGLSILSGNIYRNTASIGGGVLIGNGSSSGGTADIRGSLRITGGDIFENSASTGGGVYVRNSIFTITGGKITHNTASSTGGGMHVCNSSAITLTGGIIADNAASTGSGVSSTAAVDAVTSWHFINIRTNHAIHVTFKAKGVTPPAV